MTYTDDYVNTIMLVVASFGAMGISEESRQIAQACNNTDLINVSIYQDATYSILDSDFNTTPSVDILDEETHQRNVNEVLKKHASLFRKLKDR
jgi:hypothetical protein